MLATTLSALYGKLLVVMGIAFPMAEVISTYIPPSFYEVSINILYIIDSLYRHSITKAGRPCIA